MNVLFQLLEWGKLRATFGNALPCFHGAKLWA